MPLCNNDLEVNVLVLFTIQLVYKLILKIIKYVAYSSQGNHTGQLDIHNTDWQMAVRRDNLISITLRQI